MSRKRSQRNVPFWDEAGNQYVSTYRVVDDFSPASIPAAERLVDIVDAGEHLLAVLARGPSLGDPVLYGYGQALVPSAVVRGDGLHILAQRTENGETLIVPVGEASSVMLVCRLTCGVFEVTADQLRGALRKKVRSGKTPRFVVT
jgi:hypothetical protein